MVALQKNDVFAERYLLKDLIGTRGISEVWVSEDLLNDNAVVAVKVYAPLDKTDEKFLHRIRQEVAQNQTIHHANLLLVEAFDIYGGSPYSVMPYMSQGSLRRRVLEKGPLTDLEIAALLKQIGGALHHLHTSEPEQLHQNVKPDNILISADGKFMLADFRIHNQVRSLLPHLGGSSEATSTAYAPPELFTVHPGVYTGSDIFSLGVTIYELCTGQLPWMGNGGLSLLQGAAVPYLPGTYPRELNNIITTCMDPKWENRPTAEELTLEGNYFIDNRRWKPYGRFSVNKVDVVHYEKQSPLKAVAWAAAILVALSALGFYLYTQTNVLHNALGLSPQNGVFASEAIVVTETSENAGDEQVTAKPETSINQPVATREASPATPAVRNTNTRPVTKEPAAVVETPRPEPVATQPAPKPVPARPVYPRPNSAEEYLAQLQNSKIPYGVRNKWKEDVWRFFDRRTAVNYVVGDQLIGILSINELIDIMLDRENPAKVRIDSTKKNAEGKVDQVFVYVPESAPAEEEQDEEQ